MTTPHPLPSTHAASAPPRRTLRWLGLALGVLAMLLGGLNLIVAPLGVGETGTLLGFQLFSYTGSNSWLTEDFNPLVQYYLEGGNANLLFAYGLVLAVSAGVRAGGARWVGFGLQLFFVLGFLMSAWNRHQIAAEHRAEGQTDDAHTMQILSLWLAGLVIISITLSVALAIRSYRLYDTIVVAVVVLLAGLHLWAMAMASTIPATDPGTGNPGLRLTFLAWTPGFWYGIAAAGMLLAALGAARRPRVQR